MTLKRLRRHETMASLCSLLLLAAIGACVAAGAKAWLVALPLRHDAAPVDTDLQELRKDPVPGRGGAWRD
jgi:hypothetical protein